MNNIEKELSLLLNDFDDLEKDYYILLKKTLKEKGVTVRINCRKINLDESPEVKVLNLIKPYVSLHHLSNEFIQGKYKKRKISNGLRGEFRLLPLFLDDTIEVTCHSENNQLFKISGEVSDLVNPIKIKSNSLFMMDILEKNFIFFSFKLLKEGQSRKIIEKEVLETETFLNQKFEKFKRLLDSHKNYPPTETTCALRLDLLGLTYQENSRKFFSKNLLNEITVSHFTNITKEVFLLSKILRDFFHAVSNEKLLTLHKDNQKYIEDLKIKMAALEKGQFIETNPEGSIELPVGG